MSIYFFFYLFREIEKQFRTDIVIYKSINQPYLGNADISDLSIQGLLNSSLASCFKVIHSASYGEVLRKKLKIILKLLIRKKGDTAGVHPTILNIAHSK